MKFNHFTVDKDSVNKVSLFYNDLGIVKIKKKRRNKS
jgi:hypothetical protein